MAKTPIAGLNTPFDDLDIVSLAMGLEDQVVPALLPPATDLTMTTIAAREIVFIEDDVPDVAALAAAFGTGREIHVLDHTQDGLAQIVEALEGRSGLTGLHLVTHGAPAAVDLGSLLLNAGNETQHKAQIAKIGAAMAPGGGIMLYGCDIGAGDAGAAFVDRLAIDSGVAVAASNDPTGAASMGGDWTLEIRAGDIAAAAPVAVQDYASLLNLSSATVTFDTLARFANSGGASAAKYDVVYKINGSANYQLKVNGATQGVVNYNHGYILLDPLGLDETSVSFSFVGKNTFTANSIDISNYESGFTAQALVFKGYDSSNNQVGATSSSTVSKGIATAKISFTGMTNISTLKLTEKNGHTLHYLSVDNFAVSNVSVPCYAAGTPIATPDGEVPVEALREGDLVDTVFGGAVPVKWVGHRSVACGRHAVPATVWPVRVAAGAFGPGLPRIDIFLSPDHAVYVNEVLIPVQYLIDGTAIVQVPVQNVTYYHVELATHDLLFAAGLSAESYLETGGRAKFENAREAERVVQLLQARPRDNALAWEALACAPLVVHGPRLETARRWIAGQSARTRADQAKAAA